MQRLASLILARPRVVLFVWLVIVVTSAPFAARLGDVLTTDIGFAPGGDAEFVDRTVSDSFAKQEGPEIVLVGAGSQSDFYEAMEDLVRLDGVVAVRDHRNDPALPGPEDGLLVAFAEIQGGEEDAVAIAIDAVRARLTDHPDADVLVTGAPVVDLELKRTSEREALRAEVIGLPLSLTVLVFVFGSFVSALLPLIAAVMSVTVSFAGLHLLGQVTQVATFAQIIVTMLGLAVGIDYALLLVTRFREELRARRGTEDALRVALSTAGSSVLFSGTTVLLALTALLFPPLDFVRSMGAASMIVLAVSMAAAVTAVPAMLALLGPRIDAGRVTRRPPGTRSRVAWTRWTHVVLKHPRRWAVASSLVLVALISAAVPMRFGFSGAQGITGANDTLRAQGLLVDAGLEGLLDPYLVLIDFAERGFYHPASVRAVSAYVRDAESIDIVDRIIAPTSAGSLPALFVQQYYATPELAMSSPLAALARATVSTDGRNALVRVYPASSADDAAIPLDRQLSSLAASHDLDVSVGGPSVAEREWTRTLYGDFSRAVLFVFVTTFLLLGLAFRSIAIPLKSLVLNTLTVGSAFGVITLVFQDGFAAGVFGLPGGLGFVETSVPIFIFAIVYGLSMDYEVFLVSRFVEAHERGLDDPSAVVAALSSTGGVISSAATIMVVVFSVFLFSDVVLIQTLALGLTVAVLLDATIVRSILLPATLVLLGDWNWRIPARLGRWIDRLGLRHG